MENNPKVFISYAHKNQAYEDKVLELANRLRSEGIDAMIDQYEEAPSEGWPRWMEHQITESEFVLVLCEETYNRKLYSDKKGQVVLDGKAVHGYPSTQLAQMLGLLPQSPTVPEGITVADLVARGRYPYRKFMQNMTKEDYAAVEDALERMGITELANRCVDELSGGQRQRVWIALALAQETDILLLDEPTTYLDIAYQVEILDLLTELNRRKGTTIVMILHDVNLSARYANHLFALCRGKLIAEGKPADVITEELMQKVYQLNCIVMKDPLSGAPLIVPKGKY